MTATMPLYRICPEQDAYTQRIIAVDSNDVPIVGAYRPTELNDWRLYVCKPVTDATGMPQPHKVHACSREDAVRWVDTIATLYTQAVR
ncbi:hypothetical protein A5646_03305 [Mycobacterium sp. 1245499.0]|uniref:hypothetical protein n=1 Tax=Mycobacterium sp. 1245499.0 TaxID=1834074 RepID=UPI00080178EB|nr:hypothetical protein [Mycobacterium sp. 1245499.0]OBK92617.1 hypothetical protein A5646_03305 [Mycobacterium sp. 1245499.0]